MSNKYYIKKKQQKLLKKKQFEALDQIYRAAFYSFVFALAESVILGGVFNVKEIWKACLLSGSTVGLLLYDSINTNQIWKNQWRKTNDYIVWDICGILGFLISLYVLPIFTIKPFLHLHLSLPFLIGLKIYIFIVDLVLNFIGNLTIAVILLLLCFKWPIIPKFIASLMSFLGKSQ